MKHLTKINNKTVSVIQSHTLNQTSEHGHSFVQNPSSRASKRFNLEAQWDQI